MNQNEQEDKNIIIFNTPQSLNLKQVFPQYSQTFLDKIIFIIHQCNYYRLQGKDYNLDIDNHRWLFGVSPNDLCKIIDELVKANIIKMQSGGNALAKKSAYYTIVQPYDMAKTAVNKHFYRLDDVKCPLHIQRWVADGYAVRNKKTTKFIKNAQVIDLAARVKQLEDFITSKGLSIPAIPEPKKKVIMGEAHSKPVSVAESDDLVINDVAKEFFGYEFNLDGFESFKKALATVSEDDIYKLVADIWANYLAKPIGYTTVDVAGVTYKFFNNATVKLVVFNGASKLELVA